MKTPAPEKLNIIREKCAGMSHDEMCVIAAALWEGQEDYKEKYLKAENRSIEKDKVISELRKKGLGLEGKCKTLSDENERLKQELAHVAGNFARAQKARYGQSSEQMRTIVADSPAEEIKDEAETEDTDDMNLQQTADNEHKSGSSKHRGGSGKKAADYSKVHVYRVYNANLEELQKLYPNCRIVGWNGAYTLIYIPEQLYVVINFRPTISYGSCDDRKLYTVPSEYALWPKSPASPSLLSHILYERFSMCLTYDRIENKFHDLGINLGKKTMCNWVIRAVKDFFMPVWEHLKQILLVQPYNQCDETTIQVINDGRKAGSTSYMWVHTSGELYRENPIILFCFELTRGTDHLRKFYVGYTGHITCDAYVSYLQLESENPDDIIVCGCMMHMRRRFSNALSLTKSSRLPEETKRALPEYRALDLIGKLYAAERHLKKLSPEERKVKRDTLVRPKMNDFYGYIESLDTNDPHMGETMKDAIQYAINQKDHLTRFLDDGNIPIDNGFVERAIRPFTTLRRNSLFCTSQTGAEATAVMCTIVATAKANNANIPCYLEYVLENMARKFNACGCHDASSYDEAFLETMMPWSEEYRAYEEQHTSGQGRSPNISLGPNQYSEPPKMPGKAKPEPKPEKPGAGKPPAAA